MPENGTEVPCQRGRCYREPNGKNACVSIYRQEPKKIASESELSGAMALPLKRTMHFFWSPYNSSDDHSFLLLVSNLVDYSHHSESTVSLLQSDISLFLANNSNTIILGSWIKLLLKLKHLLLPEAYLPYWADHADVT